MGAVSASAFAVQGHRCRFLRRFASLRVGGTAVARVAAALRVSVCGGH
jgi:hypothetical protein